jgi:hypothetical protein
VSDLLNPSDTLVEIETTDPTKTKHVLQQSQWNQSIQTSDSIVLKMHRNEIPLLVKFLTERSIEIIAVQPKHSLEDYFLSLTTSNQHVAAYKN